MKNLRKCDKNTGTTVISDGWRAYGGIKNLQTVYKHSVINHKLNFVDPTEPGVHTQSIEATWGALKRSLKAYYGVPENHLEGYLFNYMFRRFHGKEKLLNAMLLEMSLLREEMILESDSDDSDDSDSDDDPIVTTPPPKRPIKKPITKKPRQDRKKA